MRFNGGKFFWLPENSWFCEKKEKFMSTIVAKSSGFLRILGSVKKSV
jgi:hypothetical protein